MKDKFVSAVKDCFPVVITVATLYAFCYGGAWLGIKIWHCIENLLHAILFFAAVALGG